MWVFQKKQLSYSQTRKELQNNFRKIKLDNILLNDFLN